MEVEKGAQESRAWGERGPGVLEASSSLEGMELRGSEGLWARHSGRDRQRLSLCGGFGLGP